MAATTDYAPASPGHFFWTMSPNMRAALLLIALGMLCAWGVSHAQVTSTRVTPFDFQAQDANGAKLSDHQRFDTALIACLNNPACVYVQGGRYKITRAVVPDGTASLRWGATTQNTDGSPATITGYRIHYGTAPDQLTQVVQIGAVTSYTIRDLTPGTWYFGVRALTATAESDLSNVASKSL